MVVVRDRSLELLTKLRGLHLVLGVLFKNVQSRNNRTAEQVRVRQTARIDVVVVLKKNFCGARGQDAENSRAMQDLAQRLQENGVWCAVRRMRHCKHVAR